MPVSATDIPAPTERLVAAQKLVRKRWLKSRYGLVAPAIIIVGLFGILPLMIMVIYSFLKAGDYGGVQWIFSTEAYVSFLFQRDIFDGTLSFSPDYLQIYVRSIVLAVVTTVFCLALGFPTAYFMATRPPSQRTAWVFLITIPFWSNLLVRTLAVMLIIRDEGVVNDVLRWFGVIDKPIVMLYTDFAVMLGLLYSFLPFMVLPIYASLEKMDFRLVEAGFDLYATRGKVLRRIIIPLARPGIVAGCLLVFIPAIGAYVTPLILGGGKHLMIGALIALQFGSSRNWPLGSAQALILMTGVLVALLFYVRSSTGKAQTLHG
jgi:spermidine/putrescine transport system permease protein